MRGVVASGWKGAAAYAAVLLFASPESRAAPADDAIETGVHATVDCPKVGAKGRVRCELGVTADAPRTLSWGDVEILHAPAFVAPLKGRIGPGDATTRDGASWHWSFALVARDVGQGDVALRVRVVVCENDHCLPRVLDLVAHVVAGG